MELPLSAWLSKPLRTLRNNLHTYQHIYTQWLLIVSSFPFLSHICVYVSCVKNISFSFYLTFKVSKTDIVISYNHLFYPNSLLLESSQCWLTECLLYYAFGFLYNITISWCISDSKPEDGTNWTGWIFQHCLPKCIITVGTQQSHQSTTSHYDQHLSCEQRLLHSPAYTTEIPVHLIALGGLGLHDAERKEGLETQPCVRERAQLSPAQCPSMVNHQRRTRARTRAAVRHPERQLEGPEMENQPPSPPLIPHSQHSRAQSAHTTTLNVGEGSFESVVSWYYAHIYCSNLSWTSQIPSMTCLPAVYASSTSIFPINYYWM